MGSKPRSVAERFWPKVRKTDSCWEWVASTNQQGYGHMMGFDGPKHSAAAHRVSWVLAYGEIPHGMWVLHRCDNRACVRPDHLFLGDSQTNVNDMIAKGRNTRGSDHPKSKLTESDVVAIRDAVRAGVEQKRLAPVFGVCKQVVNRIALGKDWRHIL